MEISEKVFELFNQRRLSLRKGGWEGREWDEYEFIMEFDREWKSYVDELGCQRVNGNKELVKMWNLGSQNNTICIRDPEESSHSAVWILVPLELANRALALGYLP